MFTGEWSGIDADFYAFLGVKHVRNFESNHSRTALFIDPDKGVSGRVSVMHTSCDRLAQSLEQHTIVFAFDQSFSRSSKPKEKEQMVRKLAELKSRGCEEVSREIAEDDVFPHDKDGRAIVRRFPQLVFETVDLAKAEFGIDRQSAANGGGLDGGQGADIKIS